MSFKLTHFVFCGLIVAYINTTNADAQAKASRSPFSLVVENNNRIFFEYFSQERHLFYLCRYLACSERPTATYQSLAGDNLEWCKTARTRYTRRLSAMKQAKADIPAGASRIWASRLCPKDRLIKFPEANKGDRNPDLWEPLSFQESAKIRTIWSQSNHQYERRHADKARRLVAQRDWNHENWSDGETCEWKLEPLQNQYVQGPCRYMTWIVQTGTKYTAHVRITKSRGEPKTLNLPSREVSIKDVFVVTLGDSFASGEGLPHTFRRKTNRQAAVWLDRRCHRSLFNFSNIAMAIAAFHGILPKKKLLTYTLYDFSCSGAEIGAEKPVKNFTRGGILQPYAGRETDFQVVNAMEQFSRKQIIRSQKPLRESLPSQLKNLKKHLCPQKSFPCNHRKPDYLWISIGGNDIEFGDLLFQFIKSCRSEKFDSSCLEVKLKDRFSELDKRFSRLVKELDTVGAKRIFLIEYSDFLRNERLEFCDDFDDERALISKYIWKWAGLGLGVNKSEADFASRKLLKKLNDKLNAAVPKKKGWTLITTRAYTKSKGYCSKRSWYTTFEESVVRQGYLMSEKNRGEFEKFTTGVAHPNVFSHHWVSHRLRCVLDYNGDYAKGKTDRLIKRSGLCYQGNSK